MRMDEGVVSLFIKMTFLLRFFLRPVWWAPVEGGKSAKDQNRSAHILFIFYFVGLTQLTFSKSFSLCVFTPLPFLQFPGKCEFLFCYKELEFVFWLTTGHKPERRKKDYIRIS